MLNVMELIGFGAGGDLPPAVLTFIGSNSSTSNSTSYTFTAQSIGTAAADRLVVVCAEIGAGTAETISSMTIGGVSANLVVKPDNTIIGFPSTVAIFSLLVTSGTTADIVVTPSATVGRCAIQVYTITGLQSTTAYSTGSNYETTTAAVSTTINYLSGGVVIGCAVDEGSTGSFTWTNLTEDYDAVIESADTMTSASKSTTSNATGETITATYSISANDHQIAVASWR